MRHVSLLIAGGLIQTFLPLRDSRDHTAQHMRLLPPTAAEAEQKAQQPTPGVSRRAETLRSGLQAIVAGDAGARLTLLSRQGLTLSSEAGRRLYSCCRPDVRSHTAQGVRLRHCLSARA